MKRTDYKRTMILVICLMQLVPQSAASQNGPSLINRLAINIGTNLPVGTGVLSEGAYPFGLSLYISGTHMTTRGHEYELLTGVDIIADYGGGIYLTLPVLVNRTIELARSANSRYSLSGFAGMGYSFQHIFSRTDGAIVKNQHAFAVDVGLKLKIALGQKWDLNLRIGAFHAFTRPVQVYFAGTHVTSEDKYRNTTLPLLIGFSRKVGAKS